MAISFSRSASALRERAARLSTQSAPITRYSWRSTTASARAVAVEHRAPLLKHLLDQRVAGVGRGGSSARCPALPQLQGHEVIDFDRHRQRRGFGMGGAQRSAQDDVRDLTNAQRSGKLAGHVFDQRTTLWSNRVRYCRRVRGVRGSSSSTIRAISATRRPAGSSAAARSASKREQQLCSKRPGEDAASELGHRVNPVLGFVLLIARDERASHLHLLSSRFIAVFTNLRN